MRWWRSNSTLSAAIINLGDYTPMGRIPANHMGHFVSKQALGGHTLAAGVSQIAIADHDDSSANPEGLPCMGTDVVLA